VRTALAALFLALLLRAEPKLLPAPLGLDIHLPAPQTNPLTPAKVDAGRRLFFDTRLSRDRTLACASCHEPVRSFSDSRVVARGVGHALGTRNVPTLVNRGYGRTFFWDGRADTLERQVLQPIVSPIELALTERELEQRTGMTAAAVAAALASYVRTIRSGDSRFDRFAAGDSRALDDLEKAGLQVFRARGGCSACHAGPNFTDEQFHNTGVAWRDGRFIDDGRFAISMIDRDRGAFKTPTLREVARTAPYMHDGTLSSLEEVVDFYSDGGRTNPYLDAQIAPRHFTADEKRALVAFLRTLTGTVQAGVR